MAAPADGQEGAERVELRFPVAPREQSVVAVLLELLVDVLVALGLTRVACHVPHEPYASGVTSDFGPITVPRGSYRMPGDDRQSSEDSRTWGPPPRRNIIGTAIVRDWPPHRFGIL
jgi:Signal peptidase, peptidase S26